MDDGVMSKLEAVALNSLAVRRAPHSSSRGKDGATLVFDVTKVTKMDVVLVGSSEVCK